MNFWETIRGHHLADVLIRCLPEIAEKKKEQYVKRVNLTLFETSILEEIQKGNCYINHQVIGDEVILIFEKEC